MTQKFLTEKAYIKKPKKTYILLNRIKWLLLILLYYIMVKSSILYERDFK